MRNTVAKIFTRNNEIFSQRLIYLARKTDKKGNNSNGESYSKCWKQDNKNNGSDSDAIHARIIAYYTYDGGLLRVSLKILIWWDGRKGLIMLGRSGYLNMPRGQTPFSPKQRIKKVYIENKLCANVKNWKPFYDRITNTVTSWGMTNHVRECMTSSGQPDACLSVLSLFFLHLSSRLQPPLVF